MSLKDVQRLVVATVVFIPKGDSILLVKQRYGRRYWSLPGGVVETGETLEEAAIREVKEETGLEIRIRRLIGIYSKPDEGAIAISLEAEAIAGSLQADNEIMEVGYFPLDNLPTPVRDHLRQRIEDFRAHQLQAVIRDQ